MTQLLPKQFQSSQTMESDMIEKFTNKERLSSERMHDHFESKSKLASKKNSFWQTTSTTLGLFAYTPEKNVDVENLDANNIVGIDTLIKNIDKVMNGKVFMCRSVAPVTKIVSLVGVVEDPKGDKAVQLGLYNFSAEVDLGITDFEDVLPIGMYLAIKNPWMKRSAMGGLIVRCDNPAEIEFISQKIMRDKFPGSQFAAFCLEYFL
jgi:hypothetical protein